MGISSDARPGRCCLPSAEGHEEAGDMTSRTHYDTVIIGGGQAGLIAGYELRKRGRDFVILDAHSRVGDAWRTRWDSLRLFTPGRDSALPGLRMPVSQSRLPT